MRSIIELFCAHKRGCNTTGESAIDSATGTLSIRDSLVFFTYMVMVVKRGKNRKEILFEKNKQVDMGKYTQKVVQFNP